ncbi:uncharacterized protein LOC134280122 [Saccostrea cucullata]|uniref:uncharacterized protein LOC134280122 n=1 Tax=Saccostrea cuccullata TaxID=36930 RepID=UPI002ED062F2
MPKVDDAIHVYQMDSEGVTQRPHFHRSLTLNFDGDRTKNAEKFCHQLIRRSADEIYMNDLRKQMKKYLVSFEYGPADLDEINHIYRRLHNISSKLPKYVKDLEDPEFRFCIIANNENRATNCGKTIFECTPNLHNVRTNEPISCKEKEYWYRVTIVDISSKQDEIEDMITVHSISEVPKEYLFAFMDKNNSPPKQQTSNLLRTIPANHFLSGGRTTYLRSACHRFLIDCIGNLERSLTLMTEKDSSYLFDRLEVLKGRLHKGEEKTCRTLSVACMDFVRKGAKLGVTGHVLMDGVLTLYIDKQCNDLKSLIKNIRDNFNGKIEEIFVDKGFPKGYSNIMPGGEIISPKGGGTLGMFGHLDGSPVAVTGGHVIEKGQLAQVHIDDILAKLGTCIWPIVTQSQTNIPDIAVIELDGNMVDRISYRIGNDVAICTRKLLELKNRGVFKYVAATQFTRGFIQDIDSMSLFDSTDVALVAHKDDDKNFAEEGDSGAIVLTRIKDQHFAIGVVYGGKLESRDSSQRVSPKTTVIVSLNHAIQRFKKGYENFQVLNLDSV